MKITDSQHQAFLKEISAQAFSAIDDFITENNIPLEEYMNVCFLTIDFIASVIIKNYASVKNETIEKLLAIHNFNIRTFINKELYQPKH